MSGDALTWLGTAGFVLRLAGRVVVLDPYVTRPGPLRLLLGRLDADRSLVDRWIPPCHEVLVGHAHVDHVLDAPALCLRDGARLLGSESACRLARAAGVPAHQLVACNGGAEVESGPLRIEAIPSRHGLALLGRVPLPGPVPDGVRWPPRLRQMRCGEVLNWEVRGPGLSLLHVDSADFVPERLRGRQVDVLCLCAVGRHRRPGYTREILSLVRPTVVIPCHWDAFWWPLDTPPRELPRADLDGFVREIEACGVAVRVVPPGGTVPLDALR